MSNKKILVVDDDNVFIELIDMCLSKRSIDIYSSNNITEAAEVFCEHNHDFDAVILDRQMPGGDGNEFLRAIRNKYNSSVPVMMLTGKNDTKDIISSLEIGANDYIVKPFGVDEFVSRFKKMINMD